MRGDSINHDRKTEIARVVDRVFGTPGVNVLGILISNYIATFLSLLSYHFLFLVL